MKSKLGLLTMCRRAGKLSEGMDMAKNACRDGNAYAVLTASDLSEKSLKEIAFVCERDEVKLYLLDNTMDELWQALGRRTGILAVTDSGFAKALTKDLTAYKAQEQLQ